LNKSQWLKCNRTQGNAVPPPPISAEERSPTSKYPRTQRNAKGDARALVELVDLSLALQKADISLAAAHRMICSL